MSQTIKEVWRKEKDLREFIIESDEKLKCADISFFSAIPQVYDRHPEHEFLIVHDVDIKHIDGLQYRVIVNYWITKAAPLPRKEVISIQRQKAMDDINEAITTAKEVYQESVKKHSTVSCCDIVRSIKDLTSILMSLEVYREQGKAVDVTGIDGKYKGMEAGDRAEDQLREQVKDEA